MLEEFKNWLISIGRQPATANTYANAIIRLSEHYSQHENLQTPINIYAITDQNLVSQISSNYKQTGKYSEFGYQTNSLYRCAMNRYSEFFVGLTDNVEEHDEETLLESEYLEEKINFAYEKDLQTTLCSQISELFPEYRIFQEPNKSGIEYTIQGKRIDVLLEHIKNNNLLAVELKSGIADYRVFGQISMYLGLLLEKFPNTQVSGVIIAGAMDSGLLHACNTTNNIKLMIYHMSLELEQV